MSPGSLCCGCRCVIAQIMKKTEMLKKNQVQHIRAERDVLALAGTNKMQETSRERGGNDKGGGRIELGSLSNRHRAHFCCSCFLFVFVFLSLIVCGRQSLGCEAALLIPGRQESVLGDGVPAGRGPHDHPHEVRHPLRGADPLLHRRNRTSHLERASTQLCAQRSGQPTQIKRARRARERKRESNNGSKIIRSLVCLLSSCVCFPLLFLRRNPTTS